MKFGGTSVGSASSIQQVRKIVKDALLNDKVILVVSAMSGTTDQLIDCGRRAAGGDESYRSILQDIETRHLDAVKEIIPVQHQSYVLSFTKTYCNEMEDVFNGIYLLGELSNRTLDRIMSYGEMMSSKIIAASFELEGCNSEWKDSRSIIQTDSQYGNAVVNFTVTNSRIEKLMEEGKDLLVVPGFISADAEGITTTLGSGGSDYTAAIIAALVNSTMHAMIKVYS